MLDAKFYILLCGWLDFFFFVILEESVQVPWVWLLRALQTLLYKQSPSNPAYKCKACKGDKQWARLTNMTKNNDVFIHTHILFSPCHILMKTY